MKDITGFRNKRLVAMRPTSERKNKCVVWECQCDCGNIVYIPNSYITSGKKGSCGCLEKESQQSFGKRTANINAKDITNIKFGRLTALYPTEKRKGTSIVWHCICECGTECDVSVSDLGRTVFSCGCYKKECAKNNGKKFIINLIGNKYGKLTVVDYVEIDKKGSYWKCKCDCGNETIVSARCLTNGHTMSCGCMTESHGEFIIKTLLNNANIKYEFQYSADVGFKSGYKAKFDFAIIKDNNFYLIEYDGEQHFKNTGYGILKETQERDILKNQWCKDNNIPLIRIPYTHLKNLCLDDLLLETSKYIV